MIRTLLLLLALALPGTAFATEAGWALLRDGGHVILLRHANAPGAGDPANFDIENCRTQRNLSDRGRQQARKIGALFAARAAPVEKVYASRYCRTMETARLAFGDRDLEPFAPLDPAPRGSEAENAKDAEVLELARNFSGSGNLVLVTHEETIAALSGISPREGEAVVVVPGDDQGNAFRVLARIIFN